MNETEVTMAVSELNEVETAVSEPQEVEEVPEQKVVEETENSFEKIPVVTSSSVK